MTRTLVLGAGGIGGYFGGRLVEAGADVTFLVRSARADRLRAEGLRIESPFGDARVTVKAVEQAEGPYDLVLLSCKSYDLDEAIASIRPAVGVETAIVPMLNGLAHLDRLDAAFGPQAVLGGLAHISAALAPDGTIRHLNKLQTLTLGPRTTEQAARCEKTEALLRTASFDTRRSEDILQEMWEKFAFITAAAAVTCLMRASVGAIMASNDGERLTLALIAECDAVAKSSGHAIRPKAQGWARPFLTQRGSDFTASMLRDLESGGRIEADHLQGYMIGRGEVLGVPTDLLEVAYCHLQAYQHRRLV